MVISDIGKLALLLVVTVGLVVGLVVGAFGEDPGPAWGLLGLIVGAILQSGSVAVRRGTPSAIVGPVLEDHEIATTRGPVPAVNLRRLDPHYRAQADLTSALEAERDARQELDRLAGPG